MGRIPSQGGHTRLSDYNQGESKMPAFGRFELARKKSHRFYIVYLKNLWMSSA